MGKCGALFADKQMKIVLVRHGQTEWNRLNRFQGLSDIPLNSLGIAQADSLAIRFQREKIDAIYSSQLLRARQTAERIGRFHPEVQLFQETGFAEMDLGDFEGLEVGQWQQLHQEFREQWLAQPANLSMPGGESLQDVQRRAVNALQRICLQHGPGSTVFICSHNFVIVSLLCFAAKISLNRFREMRQETAAVNILYFDGNDFRVGIINDRGHLN